MLWKNIKTLNGKRKLDGPNLSGLNVLNEVWKSWERGEGKRNIGMNEVHNGAGDGLQKAVTPFMMIMSLGGSGEGTKQYS